MNKTIILILLTLTLFVLNGCVVLYDYTYPKKHIYYEKHYYPYHYYRIHRYYYKLHK